MSPALLLLAGVALAEEPKPPALTTDGELRLIGSSYPDTPLDPDGGTTGQGYSLDSRLRGSLDYKRERWKLGAEVDLFDGQLSGDVWDIEGEEDARHRWEHSATGQDLFAVRRAALEGRLGVVGVQLGLVTSHWGLGMVANDGAHDPVFGRNDFGDRVARVRVAARPLKGGKTPLTFILAGDRVIEDDTAEWSPFRGGQAAWQGIASVLWTGDQTLGIYGVYRNQREADGERLTEAGVLDLYADAPVAVGDLTLRLAAEAAGITGHTSRSQSYNARDGLKLLSAGATGLASLSPEDERWNALLRVGWGSGDGDPDDGASHDFSFDRDFDVGMVLFREVQGAIDANTYAQLNDPALSGGPPEGAELLVGEGAVKRAAFVQAAVGAKALDWLALKAGCAISWSTAPNSQAFYTFRNGGIPVNQLNEPLKGYALGTEFDWAVTVGDLPAKLGSDALRPAIVLQGGHLLASKNLGGGASTLIMATGRLRW